MFVHGKRKSIKQLTEYIDRLKRYTKDLHIMGARNSYSKTDNDATFMRMNNKSGVHLHKLKKIS
ncbi:MAG: hypothetical protein RSG52_02415 [Terrisporobacter sp.]|uniref:hypothetical protein n=1 Tax=Terrisporobacter sp. TaxID=1965305 RepID=UPI002FCA0B8C